ncbi:MAG: hypothetical protein Ct9H300mP1_00860 [Planctomycetaceae bacterium]|nr:MAG: hypothetical protein Ct9H300mP1_00860 [Planctomycetaceae bacterium]
MLVWLIGGPSHPDLFDPKPKARTCTADRSPPSTPARPVCESPNCCRAGQSQQQVLGRPHQHQYNGGHREAGSIGMTGYSATDGGEGGGGGPPGVPTAFRLDPGPSPGPPPARSRFDRPPRLHLAGPWSDRRRGRSQLRLRRRHLGQGSRPVHVQLCGGRQGVDPRAEPARGPDQESPGQSTRRPGQAGRAGVVVPTSGTSPSGTRSTSGPTT